MLRYETGLALIGFDWIDWVTGVMCVQGEGIRYLHVMEDAHVSIGVFFLRKHAVIPLHNHPSMTVLRYALSD